MSGLKPAAAVKELSRFYRDFSETASSNQVESSEQGVTRYSNSDMGHSFYSYKARLTGVPHEEFYYGYPQGSGRLYPLNSYGAPNPRSPTWWTPGMDALQPISWNVGDRTTINNRLFNSIVNRKPALDIAETVVELLSGNIPKLLTNTYKRAKNLASDATLMKKVREVGSGAGADYLGGMFGWAPLVSDVIKVVSSLTAVHTAIYASGDRYKRSVPLQTMSATTSWIPTMYHTGFGPVGRKGYATNYGPLDHNHFVSWDWRFTARTTGLARPTRSTDDFLSKADELLYNLGFGDLSIIWDLTAFSWLADWCIHLGASITNATAFGAGRQNVDYAYVTLKIRALTQVPVKAGTINAGNGLSYTTNGGVAKFLALTTVRDRATPYGFGVELPSLTGSQMAILAALGLVKTR